MAAEAMSRDEIDAFLRDVNAGVLSLTDGTETYAIPESFGYDGENLYFQLVHEADSKKMSFLETTDVATVTAFTEDPARSVVVRGPLEIVSEADEILATSAIAENATIPTLNVSLESTLEELSFDFYRLTPQSISGRNLRAATTPE